MNEEARDELLDRATPEIRPRTTVIVYGGLTWPTLEDYDDVADRIRDAYKPKDDDDEARGPVGLELTVWEPNGDHFRGSLSPGMIVGFHEITDERWSVMRAQIEAAAQQAIAAERQQHGPPRIALPGSDGPLA